MAIVELKDQTFQSDITAGTVLYPLCYCLKKGKWLKKSLAFNQKSSC
ncbi:hypothetical protein YSY43_35870 [Paenibacillus sp. YSY-4.3]